jgi:hypothetical protein
MDTPTDKWLGLINFYLIMASAGELTRSDFSDQVLAEAYRRCPGDSIEELGPLADQLVLEFQQRKEDSGDELISHLSPLEGEIGESKESPDGPVSVSVC